MIEDMDDWDQLGQVIILWISAFIILIAFAVVAIQVFLTVLEFYMFMGLSAILLPFGINKHTKFIAERTLGGVVNYGVKLMVLAFILSVTEPTLTGSINFSVVDGNVEWNEIFSVMVIAWAIALLAWNAPGIAAGIVSGSPSLTAGTALQNTVMGGALIAGTGAAAIGSTKAAAGAATKMAGNATAGYQRGSAFTQGGTASKVMGGIAGATESLVRSTGQKLSKGTKQAWHQGNAINHSAMVEGSENTSNNNANGNKPNWASQLMHTARHTPHESHASAGLQARL